MIAFFIVVLLMGAVFFLALISLFLFLIKSEIAKSNKQNPCACGGNCACNEPKDPKILLKD
jgi:hypothetical protein